MLDLSDIVALGAAYTDKSILVSSNTYAVLLSSFTYLSKFGLWENNGMTPTPADIDQIDAIVSKAMDELMVNTRVGEIIQYVGGSAAPNVLPCDGTTYVGADYPELFAVIDPQYVSGSNFVVPDMRGRVLVAAGAGLSLTARSIGDSGGEEEHALTINEMPEHEHEIMGAVSQVDLVDVGAPLPGAQAANLFTSPNGGDVPHNNMQPFAVVNFGVVYR